MATSIGRGQLTLTDLNDVIASNVAPENPVEGSLWFNKEDNSLYVYNNGSWILASPELQIGGRNLVINSTFNNGMTDWTNSYEVLTPEDDKPTSSILRIASVGYTSARYAQTWSREIPMSINPNNTYTLSFDIKIDDLTALADTDVIFSIRTFAVKGKTSSSDSAWEKTIKKSDIANKITNGKWYRHCVTFQPTASEYIRVSPYLTMNGVVYYREIKLEVGNTATDWTPSPEDVATKLSSITETLGNMANDNIIDYSERQVIKDKLTNILGYVIVDNISELPTSTVNDQATNGKGSFYFVRKNATMSGLPTSNEKYIAVETQYNNLKIYLESMSPKPWDVSEANKGQIITIDKSVFRDKWLQYYKAEQDLANATADQLKKNVDNVSVGGTNWASNGNFEYDIRKSLWASSYVGDIHEIVDISTETPPFHYAYHVRQDTNGLAGIFSPSIWKDESANAMLNKEITISFWLKYQNITQGISAINAGRFGELIIVGENDNGEKKYLYLKVNFKDIITGSNMTWEKYSSTARIVMPDGATKITGINFKHGIENGTGEFWTTGIKIEIGNKATDWSQCPLDIQARLTDVEFKVTPDGIFTQVSQSQAFNAAMTSKQDLRDYSFENGVSLWKKDKELTTALEGTIQNGQGNFGSNAIQLTGDSSGFYGKMIPVNTNHVYKVTFRVKQLVDPTTAGLSKVYAGVAAYDANKQPLVTQTFGLHRYCAVHDQPITVADGWQEYTGTISLEGDDDYSQFITGTKYAVPVFIVNNSGGDGVALVDYCTLEDISEVEALGAEIDTVKQSITPSGITTVISQSDFYNQYLNDLEGKADSSKLGDYATQDQLKEVQDGIGGAINDGIANLNIDQVYATKQELQQTATDFTAKFTATGGLNLIKNSIGYADFDFWTGVDGNMQTIQNTSLDSLGFGSGFYSPVGTTASHAIQEIVVVPDQTYSLGFYMDKTVDNTSSSWAGIDILNEDGSILQFTGIGTNGGTTSGWQSFSYTFTPTTATIKVRITIGGYASATLTGLMLNIGDIPLQWSLATGETYNTNVRLDINGIRVSQLETLSDGTKQEVGYTQITPEEFAGYYDLDGTGNFDKVFYLNGDETVTKKFIATDEISMGSLKIIPVTSTNYNGWAFVPKRR